MRVEQMPNLPAVLSYGHHTTLLYTRQQILRRMGCAAENVSSFKEYRTSLARRTPRIIVLCQTLTHHECGQAHDFVHEHWPNTRLLLMYVHDLPIATSQHCFALPSAAGPQAFVHTIEKLLQDQSN